MNEEWRPIEGYEGLYEVSSYGRVRSLDKYVKCKGESYRLHKGKVLSPAKDTIGYLFVILHCNGKCKTIRVHRLVAKTFLPNPDNLPEVNHINEDKTNNRVDNLEFCDHKYNMNFGTRNIRAKETAIKNGYWTGLSREEYRKKYNQDRKEHRKRYYQENKEHRKRYYQEKKDHIKEYYKKYYQEHKNEYNERQKEYYRRKKRLEKDGYTI